MKRITGIAAIIATIALAAVLAGCSSGSSSPSASAAASASASAAASESASASAASESASASASASAAVTELAPGMYSAEFDTDSSMFHVNESKDGKGELAVAEDGSMVIHVSLVSKKIVNLYVGTAAEAQADEANVIQPTLDTVKYSDGIEDQVFGFDIPVPAIGEEFDVAILGEKGTWYDHKVSVSDPVAL